MTQTSTGDNFSTPSTNRDTTSAVPPPQPDLTAFSFRTSDHLDPNRLTFSTPNDLDTGVTTGSRPTESRAQPQPPQATMQLSLSNKCSSYF